MGSTREERGLHLLAGVQEGEMGSPRGCPGGRAEGLRNNGARDKERMGTGEE